VTITSSAKHVCAHTSARTDTDTYTHIHVDTYTHDTYMRTGCPSLWEPVGNTFSPDRKDFMSSADKLRALAEEVEATALKRIAIEEDTKAREFSGHPAKRRRQ
jgi:hypothetical protein